MVELIYRSADAPSVYRAGSSAAAPSPHVLARTLAPVATGTTWPPSVWNACATVETRAFLGDDINFLVGLVTAGIHGYNGQDVFIVMVWTDIPEGNKSQGKISGLTLK